MAKKNRGQTELGRLARELLGAVRAAANVNEKDPRAMVVSMKSYPRLENAAPELSARFVDAAKGSSYATLASLSPPLAALGLASPEAAKLASQYPELATVAVLSPAAAKVIARSPELKIIATESPAHAILAARGVRSRRRVKRKS